MVSLSIVIPTFNRKDKLKRLLHSLQDSTFQDFEVIVVDDFSSDGTDIMIKNEFPYINYIKHSKIELVGKSRNDGIMNASTNYVFMVDDDNIVERNTIEILYDFIGSGKEFGVIAPVTCFFDDRNKIMYAGSNYSSITGKTIFLHSGEDKTIVKGRIYEAEGFANSYLLKRDLAISAGMTDPRIPFAGEDGFLQYKIKLLGHKLLLIGDAVVYHDAPKAKMFMRATPFRLYFFMRSKIVFEKEFLKGRRLFQFSILVPVYFLWYSFTALKGEDRLGCIKAVILGLKDGLLNKFPLRYVK